MLHYYFESILENDMENVTILFSLDIDDLLYMNDCKNHPVILVHIKLSYKKI